MYLINYVDCGQAFNKDVSKRKITKGQLAASVARCMEAEDIEDVEMNEVDCRLYYYRDHVQSMLQKEDENAHVFLTDEDYNPELFFVGPDDMFEKVIGIVMSHREGTKKHLPKKL